MIDAFFRLSFFAIMATHFRSAFEARRRALSDSAVWPGLISRVLLDPPLKSLAHLAVQKRTHRLPRETSGSSANAASKYTPLRGVVPLL